ncbi:MAG: flotillin family protein [Verrucomicrobiota bacterium]
MTIPNIAILAFLGPMLSIVIGAVIFILVMGIIVVLKCFVKVEQGTALIRTGVGETKVSFSGMIVLPVVHRKEFMDISVKRIEIDRSGSNGLICKDNIRADIKVAFFVRVNREIDAVKNVAMSIGCERASNQSTLEHLFDAKFSEALKTVGKRFDFVELYEERDTFKEEILKVIGTDLNGYLLDDAAIDYLEQTTLGELSPDNILDAEGIKKITDLTAAQAKLANNIQRDKERVIKQQDVEAREAILELERQLAETEAKQQREVDTVQAREGAEAKKVEEEQRLKSEQARIMTEEELMIAEENKNRQIIVAQRNKERTDAVEKERVERDRHLEEIERDRVTALKGIERDKAVEVEKRNIQDVIKERVAVEKTVVEEQQKILDTEAFAGADREKQVAVTAAEKEAQEGLVKRIKEAEAEKEAVQLAADQDAYAKVKEAEAAKEAAELHAAEVIIEAEAMESAAGKESSAKKAIAEGVAAESAAEGLGEAQVMLARADATEKHGTAEAKVIEMKQLAEAKGITEKAEAMKLFEEAGQSHEEFKLKLQKEKDVEIAEIDVQKDIAAEQARVVGEALKSANIDIVGGEAEFFDKITAAVTAGKAVDRAVENSDTLALVEKALTKLTGSKKKPTGKDGGE